MTAAETPEALKTAAERIADQGGRTILISGGANKEGRVPLLPFIQVMKEIRSELGLQVLVHTGLVSEDLAEGLVEAGVDLALLDIIGDNRTIRDIYHLEASVEDFEQSLKLLTDRADPHGSPSGHGPSLWTNPGRIPGLEDDRPLPDKGPGSDRIQAHP